MSRVPVIGSTEELNKALNALQQVSESVLLPRSVKKSIKNIIADLQGGKGPLEIRIANAVSLLEEISEGANLPSFARVKLYDVISILESLVYR